MSVEKGMLSIEDVAVLQCNDYFSHKILTKSEDDYPTLRRYLVRDPLLYKKVNDQDTPFEALMVPEMLASAVLTECMK